MRQYFPKDTAPVRAIRVPDPTDRGAYADFTSEVIRSNWADEVRVMKPRQATDKSRGSDGGVYIPLNGSRGRTVQPGTWLVEQSSDPLVILFLTDEDMGAKYQVTDTQLPLDDTPTVVVDQPTPHEPGEVRPPTLGETAGEAKAAEPGKARKG